MTTVDPREILRAFSEQRANSDQVMRALTEHNGWYLPVGFLLGRLKESFDPNAMVADNAVIFSAEFEADPTKLLLFTDREAAHRAEGHRIGMFSSAFSGARMFAALDDGLASVSINPCSPKSECWFIDRDAFPPAHLWAQVVSLETALLSAADNSIPYAQLAAHPGFIILINEQNLPIDVEIKGVEGKCALAFTSPDRFEAFLAKQPEPQRSQLRRATLPGASLFRQMQNFEVQGVVLNLGAGRHTVVLPKVQFQNIAAAGQ